MKFIKESYNEIKHVVWPSKKETNSYLKVVLIILVAFGIYIFLVGGLLGQGLNYLSSIYN